MTEPNPPTPLRELGERLKRARERSDAGAGRTTPGGSDRPSGAGFAFRLGVELTATLAVGVGIGLLLDRWLGTLPLFLILFFLLGAAAGVVNAYRTAGGMFAGSAPDKKQDRGSAEP